MLPTLTKSNEYGYIQLSLDWNRVFLYKQDPTRRSIALIFVAKQLGYKTAYTASTTDELSAILLQIKERLNLVDKGHVQVTEVPTL